MGKTSLPSVFTLMSFGWRRTKGIYFNLIIILLVGIVISSPLNWMFLTNPEFSSQMETDLGKVYLMFLPVMLVSIFFQVWVKAALKISIFKKTSIVKSYKEAFKVLPAVLWVFVLFVLAISPAMLLLIPAFILFVHIWFAEWLVVTEGTRGLEALAKSRELSRGIFWTVLWKRSAPWIPYYLATIVLAFFLTQSGANPGDSPFYVIFTSVLSVLFMPFIYGYDYELFSLLKQRKVSAQEKQIGRYKILAIVGAVFWVLYIGLAVALTYISSELKKPVPSSTQYIEEPIS